MGYQVQRLKKNPFALLILFLGIWWGVPSAWKVLLRSGFNEFQAPAWDLASRVEDLSDYWGHLSDSKKTLIEKGKEVRRVGLNYSMQFQNLESLAKEESRLNRLRLDLKELESRLDMNSPKSYVPIVARVSRRTLAGWWQSMNLRKGRGSGLEKGSGVIFYDGIVGRINSVGTSMSEVELVTNTRFRIVAHFVGDDRPVTFQGNGILPGGIPTGIVLDVPQDLVASEEKPLELTTSELGDTFPHGIRIGKVFELEGDQNGLFKTGQVKLSPELCKIREVTILSPKG